MAQTQQIRGVATVVFRDENDSFMKVIYHDTIVVKWDEVKIILNSGGWRTNTTKTRMMQASNQYNLGYQVFQKDFEWYVIHKGQVRLFVDGIILER